MNVFEAVKGAVTTREAAGMYGIEVKRNGMAVCPFHDDRNPSMKVDKRFHCFGCGEDGDVIDFTSKLYNLSPKEAAEKLAQDFGLAYDSHAPAKRQYIRQKTDAQIWKEKEQHCFLVLSDYFHQLRKWEAEYAPAAPDETWNDLFVEAVQKKDYVGYLLDVLISGSVEEKKALIADCENEIKKMEQRRNLSMPEKLSNKDRLRQITENIEDGIKELFESDKYRQYLSTMSRFHRYSVNNTMLIYLQKPDATLVAGFNKWKNQFERYVKKGEHGITIIAPTPFKKKVEEQKLDPDTKAPMLDKNGKIVTEEKEVEIPMFRPVKVFDVSQTDGKPLPQLASDLSGNVAQFDVFMEALRRTSPVPIAIQPINDGSDGYFSLTDQRIAIREGMSEAQTVSAAVHEITHSLLHNREKERMAAAAGDETKEPPKPKDRHTEEVEAESVSYAVCQYYGIQTGENSFGYIATWNKDKELPELKASLETINKTASGLITDIDRHFKEICKERGIDLAAQPDKEAPVEEPGEALFLVDGANYLHIQTSDEGYDYTIYDAKSRLEVDGGCLANPDIPLMEARKEIFAIHGMPAEKIEAADLSLVEELQDAQPMPAPRRYAMDENGEMRRTWNGKLPEQFTEEDTKAFMAETAAMLGMEENSEAQAASMLPETPEQALDEYPMPDADLTQKDIEKTGYLDGDMLPLSKEMAQRLLEQDFTVYAMLDGGNAEMLFDTDELNTQPTGTLFAVSREEWEESPDFDKTIQDRLNHQEEREAAFLSHDGDCFAIYQVKDTEGLRDIRFEGLEWLTSIDRTVERENYDLIYTAPLQKTDSADAALDKLWYKFNNEHPADYHSPSMSVSDIVVLKQAGAVSCHYVDSFGFAPVPDFIKPENYLKAAEISTEDDYGMIDGIINNGPKQPTVSELEQQARSGQPISLMDLAAASHREEQEKKPSVVGKLKSQPKQETKKTAPKKSAEREI